MEGVPATTGNSADDGASTESQLQPPQAHENGGGFELGDRNSGGNRWPKQETLALIKIRSEMDTAFRDSNLKGPLWDNVSRKLSELGFNRSAKKCREKFENVSKYHRRTKEGRTSKSDKIYRFSDQLQALETNPRSAFPLMAGKPPPVLVEMCTNATVPLNYNMTTGSDQNNVSPISVAAPALMAVPPPPVMNHKRTFPFSQQNMTNSASSSSDTSSSNEPPQKKNKWEDFFEKLMKEVINKQEELQMRFLEMLERRETDRVAREEAWRTHEIAKMNQEHERLVMERSIVAAKDAAVIAFLQKMTGKDTDEARKKLTDLMTTPIPLVSIPVLPQQQIHQTPPPQAQPQPQRSEVAPVVVPPRVVKNLESGVLSPIPSRWPKAEINALITLRTQLDIKYQENVPKGPLWEEISAGMRSIGYNRNAKRCKEKWENINKYYKKMKEGNKKRSGDSKTCPYFDQLDAIYREKSTPIIAQPEQQWPPPQVQQQPDDAKSLGFAVKPEQQWQETAKQAGSDMENDDDYDDDGDCYDDDDEDKEDEGGTGNGGYEIVASKISSTAAV